MVKSFIIMKSLHMQTVKSAIKPTIALIFVATLSVLTCHGQADSAKYFKNTIRYNITNPVLFSWKFNVLGYERVISDHQTASVNIGRTALGGFLLSNDSIDLIDQYNDKGFNFSLDYRFYLKKENMYRAPRGLYIGPYYSYNQFSRDLTWDLSTENLSGEIGTSFKIKAHFVGAQLGYQFVFWDRLAVDLILMGPGLWYWNLNSEFTSSLDAGDEAMILEKLNEMLQEKFPGSSLVVGEGFEAQKTTSSYTMGFRYMINLGFRF